MTQPVFFEGSRSLLDYLKVKEEAGKPISQRAKVIKTNRGNVCCPRKYHLDPERLTELQDQVSQGLVPNPYRPGGIYYAFVQALINLGANQKHTFIDVRKEIQQIMSQQNIIKGKDGWVAFRDKTPRNSLCAKDINGRIIQNAYVLQRLSGFDPYGEKLRELGYCVDIFNDGTGKHLFCLRTGITKYEDVLPINEFKNVNEE